MRMSHLEHHIENLFNKMNKECDIGKLRRLREFMYEQCEQMIREFCDEEKLDEYMTNLVLINFEKSWAGESDGI